MESPGVRARRRVYGTFLFTRPGLLNSFVARWNDWKKTKDVHYLYKSKAIFSKMGNTMTSSCLKVKFFFNFWYVCLSFKMRRIPPVFSSSSTAKCTVTLNKWIFTYSAHHPRLRNPPFMSFLDNLAKQSEGTKCCRTKQMAYRRVDLHGSYVSTVTMTKQKCKDEYTPTCRLVYVVMVVITPFHNCTWTTSFCTPPFKCCRWTPRQLLDSVIINDEFKRMRAKYRVCVCERYIKIPGHFHFSNFFFLCLLLLWKWVAGLFSGARKFFQKAPSTCGSWNVFIINLIARIFKFQLSFIW